MKHVCNRGAFDLGPEQENNGWRDKAQSQQHGARPDCHRCSKRNGCGGDDE